MPSLSIILGAAFGHGYETRLSPSSSVKISILKLGSRLMELRGPESMDGMMAGFMNVMV